MIRILAISAAFLLVTVALLLRQPTRAPDAPMPDVTLTIIDHDADPAMALMRDQTPPDDTSVTRAQSNLTDILQPVQAVVSQPTRSPETANETMRALTLGALGNLGVTQTAQITQAPIAQDEPQWDLDTPPSIRNLTNTALTNLGAQLGAEPEALETLIIQAIRQGQEDAALGILLGQNGQLGAIDVPDALKTTGGIMDSRILLAALVSQTNNGQISNELRDALGMPNTSDAPAKVVTETQHYTVQSGDSLAGIAFRFYGKTSAYSLIYQANLSLLPSADSIKPGQILRLPAL